MRPSRDRLPEPLIIERIVWMVAAAVSLACGSGDTNSSCPAGLCLTADDDPSNDPSNDPSQPTGPGETATGEPGETGATSGDPPACSDCGADQVCIQHACVDVPTMCPCPVETYCDLAESTCVIGCTKDAECDEGRICDANTRTCFDGCRDDAGCPTPGDICDAMTCRPGCHVDADCATPGDICDATTCRPGCYEDEDCPLESLCDTVAKECYSGCNDVDDCGDGKICKAGQCQVGCLDISWCEAGEVCKNDVCVAGCVDSDDCGDGEACLDNKCVSGCKVDDECPLGQYCYNAKCTPGCAAPGGDKADAKTERCPIGKACTAEGCTDDANCSAFKCSDACEDECHSSADKKYVCYGTAEESYCMLSCMVDFECAADEHCTVHLDPPYSDNEISLCHTKCSKDSECADAYLFGSPDNCVCDDQGFCSVTVVFDVYSCQLNAPEEK